MCGRKTRHPFPIVVVVVVGGVGVGGVFGTVTHLKITSLCVTVITDLVSVFAVYCYDGVPTPQSVGLSFLSFSLPGFGFCSLHG